MPPEKDERAALVDMLEFAREVCSFVEGRARQDLDADRTLLRALERTLELVGECARRIPEDTRVAHPSIPWRAMVGMRNIIAHDYGRVNLDLIWRTVQRDMPPVVTAFELVPRHSDFEGLKFRRP